MILGIAVGVLLQWQFGWENAGALGAIAGLLLAQFVPTANACGLRRPPVEPR